MFSNSKKEKELIDREVELYKKEKFLEIDKVIEDYRSQRNLEIQDIAKIGLEQLAKHEHEFHHSKELKGIKLAKLESKIEALTEVVKAREEVVKADQNLLDSKTAEIKRLNDIITLLIKEQPKHTTTIQQLK